MKMWGNSLMSVWGRAVALAASAAVVAGMTTAAVAEPIPSPTVTASASAEPPLPEPVATTDGAAPTTTTERDEPAEVPLATAGGGATLRAGLTSAHVTALQRALDGNSARDYLGGAGPGPFGTIADGATIESLKTWQRANGIDDSGSITVDGPEWSLLMSQRRDRPESPGVVLAQGVELEAVRSLQAALDLNRRGTHSEAFTRGFYDTYFGPDLRTALLRWQSVNGFAQTGTVQLGTQQWSTLIASQIDRPTPVRRIVEIVPGASHVMVQALQAYLDRNAFQDYQDHANGVYDTFHGPSTVSGLKALQIRLGYPSDGSIGVQTLEWNRIRRLATQPRSGTAGPRISMGVSSAAVTTLQTYLDRNSGGDYFGYAGAGFTSEALDVTVSGLKAWQQANGYHPTGSIIAGSIEWGHLRSQVRELDARCYSSGVVICASKSLRKTFYVNGGQIVRTLDARFGGRAYDVNGRERIYTTAEGTFSVTRKVRDEVSYTYGNTPMPFAIYFYYGQAFHYSYSFARDGWVGDWGSHGCVNLRDWNGAEWLFNNTPVGTKVVVYQ